MAYSIQNKYFYRAMFDKVVSNAFFLGQFLRSPGKIGSICPSSRFLVHALAQAALDKANDIQGLIVDLGAGSGVVSRELLKCGVAPERILAVDISGHFREIFRKHCPGLELHTGDARNLEDLINKYNPGQPLQAVISSLPLRVMPGNLVSEIMSETRKVLRRRGGVLIQYTYAFWIHSALDPYGFLTEDRRFVPVNIPPALVEKYTPQ